MSELTPFEQNIDEDIEAEERRESAHRWLAAAAVFVAGVLIALWVGYSINESQDSEKKAQAQTTEARGQADQAQAEKFTLAQQVAAACAADDLDPAVQTQLCRDAQQVVREGPRGAQGIPGVQGIQGVQGIPGADGRNGQDGADGNTGAAGPAGVDGAPGAEGPAGPAGADGAPGPAGPAGADGKDGADGAVGPAGKDGADGQPPFSWVVYNERGEVIESCTRTNEFDPANPTYTCTRQQGAGG